jgi:hypothetical protein
VQHQVHQEYCKAFPKLVAWACFSWKGRGSLEWLEKVEMMNGVRYRRIPGREAEVVHAAAWSNLLPAGWHTVPQVQDHLLLVQGEAQHPTKVQISIQLGMLGLE